MKQNDEGVEKMSLLFVMLLILLLYVAAQTPMLAGAKYISGGMQSTTTCLHGI